MIVVGIFLEVRQSHPSQATSAVWLHSTHRQDTRRLRSASPPVPLTPASHFGGDSYTKEGAGEYFASSQRRAPAVSLWPSILENFWNLRLDNNLETGLRYPVGVTIGESGLADTRHYPSSLFLPGPPGWSLEVRLGAAHHGPITERAVGLVGDTGHRSQVQETEPCRDGRFANRCNCTDHPFGPEYGRDAAHRRSSTTSEREEHGQPFPWRVARTRVVGHHRTSLRFGQRQRFHHLPP